MSHHFNHLKKVHISQGNKNKLSKLRLTIAYLGIWAFSLIVFWGFTGDSDAWGYGLAFLWVILPITTFVISILIGKNNDWKNRKWIASLILGSMYMLAEYATFGTANMLAFGKINSPQFEMALLGTMVSLLGLGLGCGLRYLKSDRKAKSDKAHGS